MTMGMYKRYSGSFLSIKGKVWRVDIMQESDKDFDTVGDLDFPARTPVVITWEETSKEKAVIGSVAEITIISPGDRTYEDLYSIAPGSVGVEIFCDDRLYWSGTLDPEFYEEPYERGSNYDVRLTFSDFGILDRQKYDGDGIETIENLCINSVERASLSVREINTSYISTEITEGVPMKISEISVLAANFYDEDGEAKTFREVLEAVLQPLSLRIIQRSGKVWIYDLNGLYENAGQKELTWSSDHQTLSVDRAVNNVTIIFSPYSTDKVGDASISHEAIKVDEETPLLYYLDYNWDQWQIVEGFKFYTADRFDGNRFEGLPLQSIGGGVPFRMDAIYSGSDTAGVAWLWRGSKDNYNDFYTSDRFSTLQTAIPLLIPEYNDELIRPMVATERMPLMPMTSDRGKIRLRICCDMLLDARYNPFEDVSEYNEEGNYNMQQSMRKVFIPARLILHRFDGGKEHYCNSKVVQSNSFVRTEFNSLLRPDAQITGECGWRKGEGQWGEFWLSYYDISNLNNSYGNGWITNRPAIGSAFFSTLPRLWTKRDAGEYIILPEGDGELELQLGIGLFCRECNIPGITSTYIPSEVGLNVRNMRWMLFKDITIELVKEKGERIDNEDIEYKASVNPNAKEQIEINTICGSSREDIPGSRGVYIKTSDFSPVETLTRAGCTDHPEQLFLNTIFSQYAERHVKLSGEADLDTDGLSIYTEANQEDKRFIIIGEVQTLREDVSDITVVELSPDEYEEKI